MSKSLIMTTRSVANASCCIIAATILFYCVIVTPAGADELSSMNMAQNLGSVLAAEDFCGLSYDQTAIQAFISKHTSPNDMGFSSTLSMMTDGTKVELQSMSPSSKTAFCTQQGRVAKNYGFIK